ncbi:putative serine aminopeptidase, S33, alpha/Beta hydrolase [Helianthus anomalus]
MQGLIQIVEDNVMIEHTLSENKPIYMLGESFGGALALAVAARNPTNDFVLILANPATSYERSPLRPLALTKLIPKDTLKWRIDLLESTAAYANSRLHAVTAQVLVLASGKDNLIPSKNEARRLPGVY